MATYVISDIHGHLNILKKILNTVNFKYDGTDELYLLGDYVDWGPQSLETLLYVKELSEKYDFIHPLIGNHDLMFLEQIQLLKKSPSKTIDNWLYGNRGLQTFKSFLNLTPKEQEEVENFIDNLPYRAEVIVNNKRYLLAHACPTDEFIYDEKLSKEENKYIFEKEREEAVWTRIIEKIPYVIRWFDNENKYETFICGHTISKNIKEHFSIDFREDSHINIDCGAKIIGHYEFEHEELMARLALLRLDDMTEFYATDEDPEIKAFNFNKLKD